MKRTLLSLLTVLWFLSHSQQNYPTISLCLSAAQPRGMFKEITPDISFYWGGTFGAAFPVSENIPIRLGFDISGYFMGSQSESFTFPDLMGGYTYQNTNVAASMWPVHFNVRLDPVKLTNVPIQPYGGALIGFRVFNSRTKSDISYSFDPEETTYKTRNINLTSSYGFELGVHIRATDEMGIDFRYSIVWGGWGKYVDFETLTFDDNGDPQYQRHETRTDIRTFTVGVYWLILD